MEIEQLRNQIKATEETRIAEEDEKLRADDHEHAWQLTEKGYIRSWTTEIEEDGTIRAYYGGSEDWSENGDGYLYLECLQCGIAKSVDNPENIDWQ